MCAPFTDAFDKLCFYLFSQKLFSTAITNNKSYPFCFILPLWKRDMYLIVVKKCVASRSNKIFFMKVGNKLADAPCLVLSGCVECLPVCTHMAAK